MQGEIVSTERRSDCCEAEILIELLMHVFVVLTCLSFFLSFSAITHTLTSNILYTTVQKQL
jgi:hypothetical protein